MKNCGRASLLCILLIYWSRFCSFCISKKFHPKNWCEQFPFQEMFSSKLCTWSKHLLWCWGLSYSAYMSPLHLRNHRNHEIFIFKKLEHHMFDQDCTTLYWGYAKHCELFKTARTLVPQCFDSCDLLTIRFFFSKKLGDILGR